MSAVPVSLEISTCFRFAESLLRFQWCHLEPSSDVSEEDLWLNLVKSKLCLSSLWNNPLISVVHSWYSIWYVIKQYLIIFIKNTNRQDKTRKKSDSLQTGPLPPSSYSSAGDPLPAKLAGWWARDATVTKQSSRLTNTIHSHSAIAAGRLSGVRPTTKKWPASLIQSSS